MSIIRAKEVAKMAKKERDERLKDLKMELIKANVGANRAKAKTREIKRAIARILTFNTSEKALKKK